MKYRIESVRKLLQSMANELRKICPLIIFHQQKNMCLTVGMRKGGLWVVPNASSYDIVISGKQSTRQMSPFINEVLDKPHDGYKHPNESCPYWRVDSLNCIESIARRFAELCNES